MIMIVCVFLGALDSLFLTFNVVQDKAEFRARFKMFIFDLQVYSSSQDYTRHFVNIYISDKITAGEVLRVITTTKLVCFLSLSLSLFLSTSLSLSFSFLSFSLSLSSHSLFLGIALPLFLHLLSFLCSLSLSFSHSCSLILSFWVLLFHIFFLRSISLHILFSHHHPAAVWTTPSLGTASSCTTTSASLTESGCLRR